MEAMVDWRKLLRTDAVSGAFSPRPTGSKGRTAMRLTFLVVRSAACRLSKFPGPRAQEATKTSKENNFNIDLKIADVLPSLKFPKELRIED